MICLSHTQVWSACIFCCPTYIRMSKVAFFALSYPNLQTESCTAPLLFTKRTAHSLFALRL